MSLEFPLCHVGGRLTGQFGVGLGRKKMAERESGMMKSLGCILEKEE